MILLASTSDILRVITGAIADVRVHVSYADVLPTNVVQTQRTNTTAITTAATTTVLAAPASGNVRNASHVSIRNKSATPCPITVEHFDGTTAHPFPECTLNQNESLVYEDGLGWVRYSPTVGRYGALTGGLLASTLLTSGTSFTTRTDTSRIRVCVQAGGGGGGGANTAATSGAMGGGGAGGGYAERIFTVQPGTAYTYAIGAAGTAGAAAGGTGGTGGNSTFTVAGVTVTAFGGLGGVGSAAAATGLIVLGGANPAVSTNGDINASGQPGQAGHRQSATIGVSGNGGAPGGPFGVGGIGRITQGAGAAGVGFGGGGAGGVCINGGAAAAGAAGLAGCIVVEEYS